MRPLCDFEDCSNLARPNGRVPGVYHPKCDKHSRTPEGRARAKKRTHEWKENKKRPYRVHKNISCESEKCSWNGPFIPYMLHVDHIDGNKNNNNIENLMTLCANCHSLKTWENKEYMQMHLRAKGVDS